MIYQDIISHARLFADHLESNTKVIRDILCKYQSKQVIDDELKRSAETLRNLSQIKRYFPSSFLSRSTAVFLPLNLPLYSLILFGIMPAYQSTSLIIRVPEIMNKLFQELFQKIEMAKHYPNIRLFEGHREEFLCDYCKTSSVVIFTGRYKNFLKIQRACSPDTLILYNGVGHNPIVVTSSADIDLAVKKTIEVKLFNNGQDCAGPDTILVHRSVSDLYADKLIRELSKVRCGQSYSDDEVVVGPLFEKSSLVDIVHLISDIRKKGAKILYGGQVDLNQNIVYPCVMKFSLSQLQTFTEVYSPLFLIAEYSHDQELDLYFNDSNNQYQNNDMYISLFGESDYVSKMNNGIVLRNCIVHDVEIGTREYGGYSPGASLVSYCKLKIAKPLLIPREIHRFLRPESQPSFTRLLSVKKKQEQEFVVSQFQSNVDRIFGDQLSFAYIFGSFANGKDKRYSDIDTFICVRKKIAKQIELYLEWLFDIHEALGRIPDFKYPTEIVSVNDLESAINLFPKIELSATQNRFSSYDAMVWCHSLSQPWLGLLRAENVSCSWKSLFGDHKSRLLRSFLRDLEKMIIEKSPVFHFSSETYDIPRREPEISNFINNLKGRGLIKVLKMIPFEEKTMYENIVLRLVSNREFIGSELSSINESTYLYDPYFRFGSIGS